MPQSRTDIRDQLPDRHVAMLDRDGPEHAMSGPLIVPPADKEGDSASFRDVLANGPFRSLWIAQVCSQLAQNLTWITLGAFVANQTHKSTLVSVIIVSAMMAQLFLSGFAGVLVDRVSKRAVLLGSNVIRIVLTLLFLAATPLDVTIQTTVIIVLIFIANAVSQFFMPAEAATIPLLVEKRNLIAATSLFNITFNACQVIPVTLGLLIFDLVGIVPVLIGVAALYLIAALLVSTLPKQTTLSRPMHGADSLREAAHHVIGDVREALRFLAHEPGVRLTIFQINVAPTFLFIFGTLGLTFVQQTFGLRADRAWILLLPAGIGLVVGALLMGRFTERARKEDLINVGLLIMGAGIAILGGVAVLTGAVNNASHHVTGFIDSHFHHMGTSNIGLIPPAMLISLLIGLAMAMSTIPAQTLVFERTPPAVRGRILAMQQLIGGAVPIIPLLTVAPLADLFGPSSVMTGLGIAIVLIGALSVYLDHHLRRGRPRLLQ
jgi:MFS family permease